jgi:hypothetical protein
VRANAPVGTGANAGPQYPEGRVRAYRHKRLRPGRPRRAAHMSSLRSAQGRSREVDEMAVRQRTQVCVDRRGRGCCMRQGRCGGRCARAEATAADLRYLVTGVFAWRGRAGPRHAELWRRHCLLCRLCGRSGARRARYPAHGRRSELAARWRWIAVLVLNCQTRSGARAQPRWVPVSPGTRSDRLSVIVMLAGWHGMVGRR